VEYQAIKRSRKVTVEREGLMVLVTLGRSADEHCLRRDMGMGSRSQKVFDECEMILDTFFSETEHDELRMVGVCLYS